MRPHPFSLGRWGAAWAIRDEDGLDGRAGGGLTGDSGAGRAGGFLVTMSAYVREVRLTLRLGIPMILGQLGQMSMHVIDTLMLGRAEHAPGGGVLGVAASTAMFNVVGVLFMFGFGLCVPVHVLCAQALGAKDPERAVGVLRHGLVVVLGFGLLVGLGFTWGAGFFGQFGFPDEVVEVGTRYGVLLTWSLLPVLLFQGLRNYAEANRHPWVPLWILLAGIALNILLNAVLIYGWGPVEARGIVGAGEATVLARAAMVVAIAVYLVQSVRFPIRWVDLGWGRWRIAEMRRVLGIGVPSGVQIAVEGAMFSVAAILLGWLGAVALAAHQVALNYAALTFMVPLGMSFATAIRVGHAHGAGDREAIRRIGLSSIGFAALLMGGFGLVFLIFREVMPGIYFRADDVEALPVIALAAQFLVVAAIFQVFDGIQVCSVASLRGIGDVKVPTVWILVGYWGIAIPVATLLAFGPEVPFPKGAPLVGGKVLAVGGGLGGVGVWIGLATGLGWAALVLLRRFWRRSRVE